MDKWELDKAEMKRNKFKLPPLIIAKKPSKLPEIEEERPAKSSEKRLPAVEIPPQPSDHSSSVKKVSSDDGADFKAPIETKVGTKLKDEIQKNIILMVLLVLVSVPMLSSDSWIDQTTVYNRGIYQLKLYFIPLSKLLRSD